MLTNHQILWWHGHVHLSSGRQHLVCHHSGVYDSSMICLFCLFWLSSSSSSSSSSLLLLLLLLLLMLLLCHRFNRLANVLVCCCSCCCESHCLSARLSLSLSPTLCLSDFIGWIVPQTCLVTPQPAATPLVPLFPILSVFTRQPKQESIVVPIPVPCPTCVSCGRTLVGCDCCCYYCCCFVGWSERERERVSEEKGKKQKRKRERESHPRG